MFYLSVWIVKHCIGIVSYCMRSALRTVVVLTTCRRLPGTFLSSSPSYCSAGAMVHTKCRQEFYQQGQVLINALICGL